MEIYREVIDAAVSIFILGGLLGIGYISFNIVVDIFEWIWPF
nr:MAG TPA: hypothetical protein [Caudoviricetes sp.]